MTTKLEAMVGYLAGRDSDPTLLDELANPSSEASRFLEATRSRSQALLDLPQSSSSPEGEARASRSRPRSWLAVAGWASAAVVALGMVVGVNEVRSRRLEALLIRAEADSRLQAERIESTLARLAESKPAPVLDFEPIQNALGRVEAGLTRLERQMQGQPNKPEAPMIDPSITEFREQLAILHRELSSGEKNSARRAEELQTSIHDVARLLRLLISRLQPPEPANEPPPAFPKARPPVGGEPRRNL